MARTKSVSKFTKSDFKSGMVVEYANGKRRLVVLDFLDVGDVLFGSGAGERFTKLANFNDDLTHKTKDSLDIVAVYAHRTDSKADGNLYDDDELLCDLTDVDDDDDDDEAADISLKDICDTFGFKIKRV